MVLVSGSFVLYFLCVGTALSFGVIYSELASVFELGDGKTGWVASLFVGLQLGCGKFTAILITVTPQLHIHDFGHGRATTHPDLSSRDASA